MAGANTATITDQNWDQEVTKAGSPVMVDFWAPWCGPCMMAGPIVDELADDYKGKIKIGKLNTDENPTISQKYNVMSIPTVILFDKNGTEIGRKVGFAGRPMYENLLKMAE